MCICVWVVIISFMCVYAHTYEAADYSKPLLAGDTTSPTALGSGTHMDTQHTVTGECVHYCCTSEVVAMKHIMLLFCCPFSPGPTCWGREGPFGIGPVLWNVKHELQLVL